MDLDGKVAIVTGATRGMGRAISGSLADAGVRVALVARTETALREAEADGRLPIPEKNPETGRRTGYTLAQVNEMRSAIASCASSPPSWPKPRVRISSSSA